MSNTDHLLNFKDMTQSERSAIASKGAHATNKVRKKKKAIKEILAQLMELKPSQKVRDQISSQYEGIDSDEIDNITAIMLAQTLKAIADKDTPAANYIADRLEGKPLAKQEITGLDGAPLIPKVVRDDIK